MVDYFHLIYFFFKELISDWGENARIIKHCNQSTKTWNKEIDQTCVTYEQDNNTSLLPTFKGVIKKPPTTVSTLQKNCQLI